MYYYSILFCVVLNCFLEKKNTVLNEYFFGLKKYSYWIIAIKVFIFGYVSNVVLTVISIEHFFIFPIV